MNINHKFNILLVGQNNKQISNIINTHVSEDYIHIVSTTYDAISFLSKMDSDDYCLSIVGIDINLEETTLLFQHIQNSRKVVDIVKVTETEYLQLETEFFDLPLFGFLYYPFCDSEIKHILNLYFEKTLITLETLSNLINEHLLILCKI